MADEFSRWIDRAAKEAAGELERQRVSREDLAELSQSWQRSQKSFLAVEERADLNWKDVFCAVWPTLRGWLEKLQEKVPWYVRWIIEAVIKLGDGICGGGGGGR